MAKELIDRKNAGRRVTDEEAESAWERITTFIEEDYHLKYAGTPGDIANAPVYPVSGRNPHTTWRECCRRYRDCARRERRIAGEKRGLNAEGGIRYLAIQLRRSRMSSALEQRPFGRTGEKVSVVGLGGAALYKHSYDLGVATVKHALDLGVSYFDTSPAYGRAGADGSWTDRGMSQLIMGEGLDGTTRPHLLATKLINYTTDVSGSTSRSPVATRPLGYRTPEDCRAQLLDNLRALRRDRVDVLLGHDMEKAKGWIPDARDDDELMDLDKEHAFTNAAIIQALREAKGQGLCSYIGLSSNRSSVLAHVLRRVELDVCLSAGEYTLLNRRSPKTMLPVVREQGIAYVIGGIFKRDLDDSDDASPFQLASKGPLASVGAAFSDERLIKLAETTGISIAALTVRYLIADQELSTILVGASTPEEIEENVAAAQAGPLPPDVHQTLEELHEEG